MTNVIFSKQTPAPRRIGAEAAMEQAVTELEKLNKKADVIIAVLRDIAKPPSLFTRIGGGIAFGVRLLGILSAVDIIKSWLGG